MEHTNSTKNILMTAMFAALIAVGAFIRIPLPPVPLTLQTLFVLAAGLMLGPVKGLFSVLVYLFIGLIGLPVFTGGGGLGAMLGPTGGFLFGLIPAVVVTGLFSNLAGIPEEGKPKARSAILMGVGVLLGTLCIYAVGLPWLKYSRSMTWTTTLVAGLYPFIIGDILKMVVAVFAGMAFKPRFQS